MADIFSESAVMATHARNALGFNAIEPIDIWKVITLSNIACVVRPLESNLSGIYVRAGSARTILLNSAKSLGHQNFTLAHELYHADYDKGLAVQACHVGVNNDGANEHAADEFAAFFLMPPEGIAHYLKLRLAGRRAIALSDVLYLEQLFGVSHQAMLRQLKRLTYIDVRQAKEWEHGVRAAARQWGYDEQLYLPTHAERIYSRYLEQAQWALEKEVISFSRYEELLADIGLWEQVLGDSGGDPHDLVD
ncbi:protein of unknown function [Sulfobacillus thermosulfidooxidans DSM 9293]|uniref:IrrE N-terminal-like domain-containing protein n=2 Tax=Sulfobacillus thermosulfidooxidans TaxID=28034 RepID=A0A1W1W6S3_SULTA|nr:ImmA/IrrE family metallo-endopeptidase [Sulfobacillus thermosulfidooxidans]PSR21826.1 MAG: ImmA/IrrE family metallo-endopeptidase [Sulfobacillus thermosulfidooxidans]SMC01984.1 protein of unknown function [Sulfobacillus thermosulfidooxidans DSM 9293]